VTDRGERLGGERHWLDRLIALIPEGGALLDLGCGSGAPIGRHLLTQRLRVTGIDAAPSLIAHCRKRLPAGTWLVDDLRSLALGRRFQGLIAWDSLFHLGLRDQRRLFGRLADHADPGAPLLFTTGPKRGVALGAYRGAPLYHASLAPAEYRALLQAQGFELLDHVVADPACGEHTIWLAQRSG
jgi:SAM-dependent methyltransferase